MQVDHHSLSYLFVFFYFCYITPFHSTSLISFFFHPTWCLTWVQYPHFILDYLICHSFIIIWEPLGPWLMRFFYALHLMHEGYVDYIIGIFEPSFLSFLSPYYLSLRYIPCLKTTLRPWLHTLCLTAHPWAILEIDWRLFLRAWWMGSWWRWFTLGHTPFTSDGFSEVVWSTLEHTSLIDDSFFWDDALHWGIVSFRLGYDGLGVLEWPYTRA